MAVAYIEVTNNHNRYLLRGARKGIEQPLQFAVVKAALPMPGSVCRYNRLRFEKL